MKLYLTKQGAILARKIKKIGDTKEAGGDEIKLGLAALLPWSF